MSTLPYVVGWTELCRQMWSSNDGLSANRVWSTEMQVVGREEMLREGGLTRLLAHSFDQHHDPVPKSVQAAK